MAEVVHRLPGHVDELDFVCSVGEVDSGVNAVSVVGAVLRRTTMPAGNERAIWGDNQRAAVGDRAASQLSEGELGMRYENGG